MAGAVVIEPRFPDVTVQLVGADGNAFAIIGRVCRALRNAGHMAEIRAFSDAAMSSADYDDLLRVVTEWVEVH